MDFLKNNDNIFSQNNIIEKINEAGGTARYYLFDILDFVTKLEVPKRSSVIHSLTHYEKTIFVCDIGISRKKSEDLDSLLEYAYVSNRTRMFYVPLEKSFQYRYYFVNNIISLILHKKLEKPEDIVRFIYNFTRDFINEKLVELGFIGIANYDKYLNSWISSCKNINLIKCAELIVTIYGNIFNVIYNMTNHDIVNYDFMIKYISYGIDLSYDSYKAIWDYGVTVSQHSAEMNKESNQYMLNSLTDAMIVVYNEIKKDRSIL